MKNKFILILIISLIILKTIGSTTATITTKTTTTSPSYKTNTNTNNNKMNKATENLSTDMIKNKEIKKDKNELNKCENFEFKWDINKIIDNTKFSKEKELPIKLSNDSKTATRVERIQGDDFPPVKIYGNKYFQINKSNDGGIVEWSVQIDHSNGFIEIGIISPELNSIYFIKGFKNEAQIEKGKGHNTDIKTFEFGEPLHTGDIITICLHTNSQQQSSNTMSMKIIKNDKVLGIPFNDIPLSNKFYPMIGLNDKGDQITIL